MEGHCRVTDASPVAAPASGTAPIRVRAAPACTCAPLDALSLALIAPRRTARHLSVHSPPRDPLAIAGFPAGRVWSRRSNVARQPCAAKDLRKSAIYWINT